MNADVALAKRMLAEPDRSIKEIAYTTGFGPANRMREVFQREEGVSPSGYRDRVIGKSS